MTTEPAAPADRDLTTLLVVLLKGVVYRDNDAQRWGALLALQAQVRDYLAVLGLELILDEAEGYAFLRAREALAEDADSPSADATPRLMARRPLSFAVSLLLALLRKKLAEFDAHGGDTRLVLSRDEIVDLFRVFLPASSNEARLTDQIERHINRVVELGFVRKLQAANPHAAPSFEVRRIIKAFVDAQWLGELDQKLAQYRHHAEGGAAESNPTPESD